uniref:Uncharacterized protein n=1 Tax=Arundo donax TaxID=35708 RepID=A0A0A9BFQ4_ARUDO
MCVAESGERQRTGPHGSSLCIPSFMVGSSVSSLNGRTEQKNRLPGGVGLRCRRATAELEIGLERTAGCCRERARKQEWSR